jgi:hypothetical protein
MGTPAADLMVWAIGFAYGGLALGQFTGNQVDAPGLSLDVIGLRKTP